MGQRITNTKREKKVHEVDLSPDLVLVRAREIHVVEKNAASIVVKLVIFNANVQNLVQEVSKRRTVLIVVAGGILLGSVLKKMLSKETNFWDILTPLRQAIPILILLHTVITWNTKENGLENEDLKGTRDVIIVDVMVTFLRIALRHTVPHDVTTVVRKDIFRKNVERSRDQENVTTVERKVTLAKTVHVVIPKCALFVVKLPICLRIVLKNRLMFVITVEKRDTLVKIVRDQKILSAISVKKKVTKRLTAPPRPGTLPAHVIVTGPLAAHPVHEVEGTVGCLPRACPTLCTMDVIRTGVTDRPHP